jgi:hypothetical protein
MPYTTPIRGGVNKKMSRYMRLNADSISVELCSEAVDGMGVRFNYLYISGLISFTAVRVIFTSTNKSSTRQSARP